MRRFRALALLALLAVSARVAHAEGEACESSATGWREAAISREASPVDLSALNDAPAGRHGFLRAKGAEFEFADGTPARFWGANVAAGAIFESPDAVIDAHAERLAKLGFNLVRLHHHDSNGWQKRTALSTRPGELLDADGMRKLDRWIARLKERGVYVWLDLHTGRVFREDEQIPGFEELGRARPWPSAKGFLYLNPRLQELVLAQARALLAHRNGLTGLRYADDPGIVALLVSNENDIAHHFGNLFAGDRGNAWHRARYLAEAATFASRTGSLREALERTWEGGPSKLLLADLEHRFDVRAREALRSAGARVPIALTSYWGRSPLFALASLSRGDFVDAHSYALGDILRGHPRKQLGYLGWIGAGQLAGKPLTVSEWNHGKPLQPERFAAPLWTASVAALQGWDGLALFAYAQKSLARASAPLWNAAADPSTIALMPAAALLYRRGDVRLARSRYFVAPTREALFADTHAPARSAAISTLLEQSQVVLGLPRVPELPWLSPAEAGSARVVTDLSRSYLAADAQRVRSDTGELERDFSTGVLRIDTARTQGAIGALAGREVALSRVRVSSATNGAVVLSSLDGRPLESSTKILVSVAARACLPPASAMWLAEPVRGRAWLRADSPRVLVPLAADGARGKALALAEEPNGLALDLDFGASWALIEAPGRE